LCPNVKTEVVNGEIFVVNYNIDDMSQMFGLSDPTHVERNVKRDVLKHPAKLQQRLETLKEKLFKSG